MVLLIISRGLKQGLSQEDSGLITRVPALLLDSRKAVAASLVKMLAYSKLMRGSVLSRNIAGHLRAVAVNSRKGYCRCGGLGDYGISIPAAQLNYSESIAVAVGAMGTVAAANSLRSRLLAQG